MPHQTSRNSVDTPKPVTTIQPAFRSALFRSLAGVLSDCTRMGDQVNAEVARDAPLNQIKRQRQKIS